MLGDRPLLPKATAMWLLDNTTLTFAQIGAFCDLHELEIQALADGDVHAAVRPIDPISANQVTLEEIKRCEQDSTARLQMARSNLPKALPRVRGPRYTPLTKRSDKPDAIFFLIKNYPELSDAQICKLIGTTKNTISKIRDKSHWNLKNLRTVDPVESGLCSLAEFQSALRKAQAKNPVAQPALVQEQQA
jgi:uncharacterized protein